MSIDVEIEGLQLCERQSLKFISARRDGQHVLVRAISREKHGEVWVIRFNEQDEHQLSECLFRFDLTAVGDGTNPDIPLCIIKDVCNLYDYMRDHPIRGLAREH